MPLNLLLNFMLHSIKGRYKLKMPITKKTRVNNIITTQDQIGISEQGTIFPFTEQSAAKTLFAGIKTTIDNKIREINFLVFIFNLITNYTLIIP